MTKNNKKQNKLPHGISEDQFLSALNNISKKLAYKFKFGYHSFEDMKQQAAIFALEGLEKYDNKRPLENFLWTHVRNRLFNYKRDKYQRPDKPCLSCPLYDPHCKKSTNQCLKFSDKNECEPYLSWTNRNNNKKNIMKPAGFDELCENNKTNTREISDTIFNQQIIDILDQHIPAQYREHYLRLKYGEKIYKSDMMKLTLIIREILQQHNSEYEL